MTFYNVSKDFLNLMLQIGKCETINIMGFDALDRTDFSEKHSFSSYPFIANDQWTLLCPNTRGELMTIFIIIVFPYEMSISVPWKVLISDQNFGVAHSIGHPKEVTLKLDNGKKFLVSGRAVKFNSSENFLTYQITLKERLKRICEIQLYKIEDLHNIPDIFEMKSLLAHERQTVKTFSSSNISTFDRAIVKWAKTPAIEAQFWFLQELNMRFCVPSTQALKLNCLFLKMIRDFKNQAQNYESFESLSQKWNLTGSKIDSL